MAFVARALPVLRVAGLMMGVSVVAAAGAGYWFFISQQRDYLVGRDFRILSNLTRQVDSTARAEAKVIRHLPNDAPADPDGAAVSQSFRSLRETWFNLRGKPYQLTDITFEAKLPGKEPFPEYAFRVTDQLMLDVPLEQEPGEPVVLASLNLRPGLETLFSSRVGPTAFDGVLLGTQEGRVLVSAGPAAQQLRYSGLDVLSSKPTETNKSLEFKELSKAVRMADVSVAGVDYTLFVAPCCVSDRAQGDRIVLAGLVRSDKLQAGSWAIPTTLVKISVLALLLALVGWPFLKLLLMGDRQRMGVSDFFQLGASSVAGLAILTVVLLDVSAYRRLNRDIDAQLSELAHALDYNATAEVAEAYAQLECVEAKASELDWSTLDRRVGSVLRNAKFSCTDNVHGDVAHPLPEKRERLTSESPELPWTYPFFDTIAFIDATGMQYLKLATSGNVSNTISVAEREYFKTITSGGGFNKEHFCKPEDAPDGQQRAACALGSVWSLTTGEPEAVLAKNASSALRDTRPDLPVTAISFPMRSLIGPVLPPGFAFAVIDPKGEVLFHSNPQRNGNENFFVETDNNRRLRAQVAAHSADGLSINYWGAQYRAFVKPMALPGMYVVAMAQTERAWAINREWLIVTLTLLAAYLVLWLLIALATLARDAAWVWPDPRRRENYRLVSIVCAWLLLGAAIAAAFGDRDALVAAGVGLPLVGWLAAAWLLRKPLKRGIDDTRETLFRYSLTAALVLTVSGAIPGALLFLASYRLHTWSYIKNSQSIIANRLADRYDRLTEAYLHGDQQNPKKPMAWHAGSVVDRDVYVDFLYNTSVARASAEDMNHTDARSGHRAEHHATDLLLWLLEDRLPYYSEASVEWRELLHDKSDDESWTSSRSGKALGHVEGKFTARGRRLPLTLTSWVPSITYAPPIVNDESAPATAKPSNGIRVNRASVITTGSVPVTQGKKSARDSWLLLPLSGAGLFALAWGLVQVFNRRVYLVGITQPLWACGSMAKNAGQNVLVLCDAASKTKQLDGLTPLALGPIVREPDFKAAWIKALFDLDRKNDDGSVLIADFDDKLDDTRGMKRKLILLEELVSDQSRKVVVLSQVSLRGLSDSVRHAAGGGSGSADVLERWKRIVKALVIVERRAAENGCADPTSRSSRAVSFLLDERDSHPFVTRICDDLLQSDAVEGGQLTRAQAFDELAERTAQFYRGLWTSCSEDEKVVLGHVARHGLANASVRSVVRQLLGRRLLKADPAFRPMNETFRHFILTRECLKQVESLENAEGPSAWDRLRAPLGIAVLGGGIFLFATQKELYNAIFGLVTAAAASVPTLIQTVGKLVGRPVEGPGLRA